MLQKFELLNQDIDTASESLTCILTSSSKYQSCLDDVEMWLTKAESDVAEVVSKIQLSMDPAIHLDQLLTLLTEVQENQGKFDKLRKYCGTSEAKQLYDGLCDRYQDLTNNLKVTLSSVLHHSICS